MSKKNVVTTITTTKQTLLYLPYYPVLEEPQQRLESTKQCSFLSKEAGELTTAATKDIHQQRQVSLEWHLNFNLNGL